MDGDRAKTKRKKSWGQLYTFRDGLGFLSFHEDESRKVGFGIWLFIVANIFLEKGKIDETTWLKCAFVSGALIGFGPTLDKWIDKYFDRWKPNEPAPTIPIVQP